MVDVLSFCSLRPRVAPFGETGVVGQTVLVGFLRARRNPTKTSRVYAAKIP